MGGHEVQNEIRTKDQVVSVVSDMLDDYARKSIAVLRENVRAGAARQVLGSVPNRPEDEQLLIDTVGENILVNLVRDARLPAVILGEHNDYNLANGSQPAVILPVDSFDNTSQYKRGLDTAVYTVVGAYHPDGSPIGGIIGDIKDRKIYESRNGVNSLLDLETNERKPITKSERTTIKDPTCTIATYMGSNEYSIPFIQHLTPLVQDMHPKAHLESGGGAYIYGLLAKGAVDAYVMFNEPRAEIDPGLPLALTAGCTVVSVNPDGSFEEYRFDPARHGESVPFFIAAATPELRDEIIGYYVKAVELQTR